LVTLIAVPVLMAQEAPAPAAPVGDKPFGKDHEVKAWTNVKAMFTLGEAQVSLAGFTVKRVVTTEPEGQFYYKENNTYWTWKEGYMVMAPEAGKDLGYFTIRYGETPKPKIYKATAPVTPPTTPPPAKTGWKRDAFVR
jgi:hypothetical protein